MINAWVFLNYWGHVPSSPPKSTPMVIGMLRLLNATAVSHYKPPVDRSDGFVVLSKNDFIIIFSE